MISLSARRPDPSSPFLQQDHLFRPKSIARAYSVQCVQCTPNCFHIFHSVSTSKSLPIGPKRTGKYLLSFLYLKLRASCPWPTSVSDFRAIIYLPILSPSFPSFLLLPFLLQRNHVSSFCNASALHLANLALNHSAVPIKTQKHSRLKQLHLLGALLWFLKETGTGWRPS